LVKKTRLKVAVFGGSFDPPHRGHQQIVAQAVALLEIDRLIVMPAYLNPFKKSTCATAEKRLEWCHLLFDGLPGVIVCDYEVSRGESTRTLQSVNYLNETYDVRYLVVGSDNLSTLTDWYGFTWLNKHITWVIVTRDKHLLHKDCLDSLQSWRVLEVDVPVSSTAIRETLDLHNIDTKIKQSVYRTLKEKA